MSGLVSIIIPCRNRSELLAQAIASCAMQTWPHIEVLVVDDGSDEDIEAVVATARAKYGRPLTYLRQTKRGASAARNLGCRHATGDFVQYLDSDDLLHPDKLTRQAQHLLANPVLDMVFALGEHFEGRPGDIRLLWNVPGRRDCPSDLERFLHEDAVWSASSPLWRRRTVESLGGWSEDLVCWQDWAFHVAALCAGIRYECIGDVLEYVRHHGATRASWDRGLDQERSCLRAAQLAHGHLSRAGLLSERLRIVLSFYVLRHLGYVEALPELGKASLRSEMIELLLTLAWTPQRRMAVRALRALSGTRLFQRLLDLQLFLPVSLRRSPLRQVVPAQFLPFPPRAVVQIAMSLKDADLTTRTHDVSQPAHFGAV